MRNLAAFMRLIRAGWILTREGVLANLPLKEFAGLPNFVLWLLKIFTKNKAKSTDRTENIARAIYRLGPSYIKLAQFLAMRPDLIGKELAEDLSFLQDQVEQFPFEQAAKIVEHSLGGSLETFFSSFEPAIAAASMAQVHPAWVEDENGIQKKVAVKIIRPDVRKRFAKDLESFFLCARLQERWLPNIRRLRPVSVVENLAQTTRLEFDLRLEAAALSETAENTKEDEGFRVPSVDWSRTGRDILTMEWVEGTKISDIETLKAKGHDLKLLARRIVQSFLRHSLRDGFFHADMHAGNLFVDEMGNIIGLDYGITGRLGRKEQHFLAEILYGFIQRDYYRVANVHFQAGYVPSYHCVESFAQANRAIGEPIHGQSASHISMAKLLGLLFEVTQLFDMQTRPELLLLQKSMVIVEGLARKLDPDFNMWQTAEPVVSHWISDNMGPNAVLRDIVASGNATIQAIRQIPQVIQQWHEISENYHANTKNGFKLDEESLTLLARWQQKQNFTWRFALWVIALTLIWIAFFK